jgi:hypothetical protein
MSFPAESEVAANTVLGNNSLGLRLLPPTSRLRRTHQQLIRMRHTDRKQPLIYQFGPVRDGVLRLA